MKILKTYDHFLNERAPSITKDLEIWLRKGKEGKKVMLYIHDDMDGIFSGIVMKGWLESKGFDIVGYGIINYQEGYSAIKLNPNTINIVLDFAENFINNIVGEGSVDIYIDHHGKFTNDDNQEEELSVKTPTGSAYEGICDQLGIPVDASVLSVIDMIDSAKYDEYDVDVMNILDFDMKKFKNKLEFSSAFNQMLKRSDFKTFIEVVGNCKGMVPSIYKIYDLFRKLYPANNLNTNAIKAKAKELGYKINVSGEGVDFSVADFVVWLNNNGYKEDVKSFQKDFISDASLRLGEMTNRTLGNPSKEYIKNQDQFKDNFYSENDRVGKVKLPGYQILGNMVFVPSGTWANALRIRALVEQALISNDDCIPTIEFQIDPSSPIYDQLLEHKGERELVGDIDGKNFNAIEDVTDNNDIEGICGIVQTKGSGLVFRAKQPLFWVFLQYGNTLQVASFRKIKKYVKKYLPKLKDGTIVDNLGEYTDKLLSHFVSTLGYKTNLVPNAKTVAGGHPGIGNITNIFGEVQVGNFKDTRYLDLFKNKIIADLSGIPWPDLKMSWGDPDEKPKVSHEHEINKRVMMANEIRKV